MPSHATALLPAGLSAGDIPNLSLFDQALIGFVSRIKSPDTAKLYRHDLELYFDWCRQQQVDVMTAKRVQLELYKHWLTNSTGWAEATASRRFGTVCLFYKRAAIDELIDRDPALGIERPEVDRGKQRRTWLSPLQMSRFIESAREHGPDPLALTLLMGECGLRVSEATSLRVEQMTRVKGWDVVSFIGKGNKAATTPLPMNTMRAVEQIVEGRTEGPLVRNERRRAYSSRAAQDLVKRIAVGAGLDPREVSPHTLRRTAATTAVTLGIPLHKVQTMLRHADPKTTTLYLKSAGLDDHASHQIAGFYSTLAG